jgi:hypothetical protein
MQILCVGIDHVLLESRCAVLASQGYRARAVLFPEAKELLSSAVFDLVILSARLSAKEKRSILAVIPAASKTLVLEGLIPPPVLLRKVSELFSPHAVAGRLSPKPIRQIGQS